MSSSTLRRVMHLFKYCIQQCLWAVNSVHQAGCHPSGHKLNRLGGLTHLLGHNKIGCPTLRFSKGGYHRPRFRGYPPWRFKKHEVEAETSLWGTHKYHVRYPQNRSSSFSAHCIDQDFRAINAVNQFVYVLRRFYYGHIGDRDNSPSGGMFAENS